jgi:hypothetical protein
MIEKYLNDTISKARQPWVERYSSMKIMPARIQAEIIKRDSLKRMAEMDKLQKSLQKASAQSPKPLKAMQSGKPKSPPENKPAREIPKRNDALAYLAGLPSFYQQNHRSGKP